MEMSIRFPGLGIDLAYVGKSIGIFGMEVTIYGLLIAAGMLLGIAFVTLEAKRRDENQDMYLDMAIVSLLAAVLGARLYYVACSWKLYQGDFFEIFDIRSGGLGFYGGLLGGVIAAAVFCKLKRLSFWQMADTACMGILIGQIIGRWGDFFNRESFGEYTDGVLAMQLPLSAVSTSSVTSLMRENLVTTEGGTYIQVHPLFLYESLWCLLLFLLLLAAGRHKRYQGEIFMKYLAGYGLGRFFVEGLRTDQLLLPGTRLPVAQVISAGLFVVFTILIIGRRTMAKKREAIRKRRREELYEAEEKKTEIDANDWEFPVHEERGTEEDERERETVPPDPETEGNTQQQDKEQGGSSEEPAPELRTGSSD